MTDVSTTQDKPAAAEKPKAAKLTPAKPAAEKPKPQPKPAAVLSTKAILAAINDGDEADRALLDALQAALYRFGAQDPSMVLALSWQRVQRRIGAEAADGVATAEQVAVFADRAGLAVTK